MRNGFDFLAPYYDQLARLIFRDEIRNAQIYFLSVIPAGSEVLILGGGTGWIIPEIQRKQPDCRIWFLDSSPGMIEQAKKSNPDIRQVTYVCGTIKDIPDRKFPVIIMPFFLDLFSPETLRELILSVAKSSNNETRWLITDFVDQGKWRQKMLLKIMYFFFRVVCSLEAISLPDWRRALHEMTFIKIESRSFSRGFIESHYYKHIQETKS